MKHLRHCAALVMLILAVSFGSAQTSSAPAQKATKGKPSTATSSTPSATMPVSGDPMDINTASEAQLKTLPGIGDAYSKRIVAGRPYAAKNQLVSKGILPQATYDKVQTSIIAKRASK